MNTRVDILFRKDQVDMTEDNKDIKILKNELWTRRISIKARVVMIRKNPSSRRNCIIGRNQEKSNKRTGGLEGIGEKQRASMER